MSKVARWSLLLTAILGAVVILLAGVGLFRAGVIESQSAALWPTYDLLNLEIFQGRVAAPTMWFSLGVQVLIWTVALYVVLALGRFIRQR
jgi:uncharacterized membrane protein